MRSLATSSGTVLAKQSVLHLLMVGGAKMAHVAGIHLGDNSLFGSAKRAKDKWEGCEIARESAR